MFAVETTQPSMLSPSPSINHRLYHVESKDAHGIVIAVQSVFAKLEKLQTSLRPIYEEFGFRLPSAGVAARDLSERIEQAIVQHCQHFTRGRGHCDLARGNEDWEVKICQHAGLTINQSKVVNGEHYIVVNYDADTSLVRRIWILWAAKDQDFSPRRPNSNARHLSFRDAIASGRCAVLFSREKEAHA